jgi:hypothetical protein
MGLVGPLQRWQKHTTTRRLWLICVQTHNNLINPNQRLPDPLATLETERPDVGRRRTMKIHIPIVLLIDASRGGIEREARQVFNLRA